MTRQQEATIDRLALERGRVAVKAGFDDQCVRVTAETGAHWIVTPDGTPTKQRANHSRINWNAE
jgi:hypothetical protein